MKKQAANACIARHASDPGYNGLPTEMPVYKLQIPRHSSNRQHHNKPPARIDVELALFFHSWRR